MDMSVTSIGETIEAFIRRECRVARRDSMFTRDIHLFDAGFVDSVGFAQLLAFIESTYGITVEEEQMSGEEFTTINGISRAVYSALRNEEQVEPSACDR